MKTKNHIVVGTIGHIDHSISANAQTNPAPKKPISLWDRVGLEMQNLSTIVPKIESAIEMEKFLTSFSQRCEGLKESYHKAISFNVLDNIAMLKRLPLLALDANYTLEYGYIIHDLGNPPQNVEIITQKMGLNKQATVSISSPIYVSFYLGIAGTSEHIHKYTVAYCIGADANLYIFSSDDWAEDFDKYRKELGIEL